MIKDFLESEIRSKILSKIQPKLNKNTPHWKGYIYLDNIFIAKVKIPNNHKRVMHKNKSQYISRDLKLTDDEFNKLIECPFKSKDFYKKMENYK